MMETSLEFFLWQKRPKANVNWIVLHKKTTEGYRIRKKRNQARFIENIGKEQKNFRNTPLSWLNAVPQTNYLHHKSTI
jgi:hypothetical protein